MIGQRLTMRERLPFWARYRIYIALGAGMLFGIISIVTWIIAGPSSNDLKEALVAALFVIPGMLILVGLAVWYRRSRHAGD